jgi:hypothetical protein
MNYEHTYEYPGFVGFKNVSFRIDINKGVDKPISYKTTIP